ncbi:MAG: MotA/TolQ/ExbB proton channel family protein [Pirellulales bacterium]|nr:MotA/TolQ/ExbB proton channel family protein [Pirellulales bacterium]
MIKYRKRLIVLALCGGLLSMGMAVAQDKKPASAKQNRELSEKESVLKVEKELSEEDPSKKNNAKPASEQGTEEKGINMLTLLFSGGNLMWPIVAMSLLVVTFGIERALALRRRKILPPELIHALGRAAEQPGGFDPRRAYKLCQEFPSTAATVIRAMLLKLGRPHVELERAGAEAEQREAGRLYANVRWLGLAATVAPLMGLLGTVWGMINAFFATANLPTGANKAETLAQGIYVALVTTFAGLAVAIPAAVLAHMFEGRIQKLFRELDEMLQGIMPQLERFEGRVKKSNVESGISNEEIIWP